MLAFNCHEFLITQKATAVFFLAWALKGQLKSECWPETIYR